MESGDGGSRRRRSASDEKVDSPNLRDFLRVKEDNDGRNLTGSKRPSPAQVNRTLLDIIRDDPNCGSENRKSWKVFRDMLRLRRAGAAWTSAIQIPASDIPIHNANRMISRRNSTRFPASNSEDQSTRSSSSSFAINGGENQNSAGLSSMPSNRAMMMRRNSSRIPSLSAGGFGHRAEDSGQFNTSESTAAESADLEAEQEEEEESGGETGAEDGEEPAARMSLMALLAETDRQMGCDGATYVMEDDEEDEEEEEEEQSGVLEYNNCCVCMVRHKGAALIPCGHTFCRLCSRELWVQRGNCPLCNGFILEILDIF